MGRYWQGWGWLGHQPLNPNAQGRPPWEGDSSRSVIRSQSKAFQTEGTASSRAWDLASQRPERSPCHWRKARLGKVGEVKPESKAGARSIIVLAVCGYSGYQVIPNGDKFLKISLNTVVISFLSLKIFRNLWIFSTLLCLTCCSLAFVSCSTWQL